MKYLEALDHRGGMTALSLGDDLELTLHPAKEHCQTDFLEGDQLQAGTHVGINGLCPRNSDSNRVPSDVGKQ